MLPGVEGMLVTGSRVGLTVVREVALARELE